MNPGLREHKSATLRVAVPEGLPEDMRSNIREILSVHSGNPRKGHATALLRQVCAEADISWFALLVQVRPYDDGLSQEQLQKFYAEFGFRKIQDQADDGRPAVLMARPPKKPRRTH